MKKILCKAGKIAGIVISFAALLMLENALARQLSEHCDVSQSILLEKTYRPPIYIMADLPVSANVTVTVKSPWFGEMAKKTAPVRSGRIAIKVPWTATDSKGFIHPASYNFCIAAKSISTGQPILIKQFGVAAGYPNEWEAINAVRITAVVPDPVEHKAEIRYLLGLEASVTVDILDNEGVMVDNVVAEQRRRGGPHEETWIRCKGAKSGPHKVRIVSRDRTGTAKDFKDFTCK